MSMVELSLLQDVLMWGLAAAMAVVSSLLLKWTVRAKESRPSLDLPFILFILITMLAMVVSAVAYLSYPSTGLLLDLIVINMFVMTGALLPIFLFMSLRLPPQKQGSAERASSSPADDEQEMPPVNQLQSSREMIMPIVVAFVILNEFFMGWALNIASGVGLGVSNPFSLFSSVINSYWFIFTMSGEMLLTTYLLRKEIGKSFVYLIFFQSLIMLLSPTAIENRNWVLGSVIGGSALMIILFIYLFEYMARNNSLDQNFAIYIFRLLGIYGLMMAGLFVWELYQFGLAFSLSIFMEMLLYFFLIVNQNYQKTSKMKSWLLDAKWTLGIVSMIFISEYFMGGLLDAQIYGRANFLNSLTLASVAGNLPTVIGAALYDFLVWFGTVTGSAWFLVMMGIEMGALVAFKIRSTRELETKIRLALVILVYAIYSIMLPYFLLSSSALSKIPFMGWSMGVGTSGPVAPALLIGIAGTYVVSGALSFLFGGRQMCSMFCTAALMYQGTFYDKMKTFNRSSGIAKKFLTTRLSNLYRIIFSVVWISVFAAIAISYLDSIGIVNLSIFGTDPVQFGYLFYFDFLWYIAFITIPFVGTYACVSMGWCHWGTFNQLVGRLGFFKLKVKSTDTCVNCATRDCASACPVGLSNLPGEFISKGEMKSHKCIGVGDCVSSCPYENIQFHDIRHWVRAKTGSRKISREQQLIQLGGMTRMREKGID
jgi:polyferredoxin